MTLLTNSFEGGTNGSNITTGNSGGGSGNAFDIVTTSAGGVTPQYNSSAAFHGSLGAVVAVGGTTGNSFLGWTTTSMGGTQTDVWFRAYINLASIPTATLRLIRILSSGAVFLGSVSILSTGKIRMINAAGTAVGTDSTTVLSTGTWYRIECHFTGNATTGFIEWKLFASPDSTTVTETKSASSVNTSGVIGEVAIGDPSSATSWSCSVDDVALSTTNYPGPSLTTLSGDTGTGSDSLSVVNNVALSQSGSGSEAFQAAVAIPLAQSGTGSDSLSVSVGGNTPSLAESGTGDDSAFSVIIHQNKSLTDSGSGSEGLVTAVIVPTTLSNNFEYGTPGTSLTTSNTSGPPGPNTALDAVNGISAGSTVQFDNAHAHSGAVSVKLATPGTAALANLDWTAAMGTQPEIWARAYFYFTANPSVQQRIISFQQSGGNNCASVHVNTDGTLDVRDSTATDMVHPVGTIPLNKWFRVEVMLIGSATVGQAHLKAWTVHADDTGTADIDATSAASFNTSGPIDKYDFGVSVNTASIGPFWMDDIALSNIAFIGPAALDYGTGTESLTIQPSQAILRFGQAYTTGLGNTTINVPIPTGIRLNDEVNIWAACEGFGTISWTEPSGLFSTPGVVQLTGAGAACCQLFQKSADASDVAAAGTGFWPIVMSASHPWSCGLAVVFGANPLNPNDGAVASGAIQPTMTTLIPAASLLLSTAGDLIVWFGATRCLGSGLLPQTITPPSGYAAAGTQANNNGTGNSNTGVLVASTYQGSNGATGSIAGSTPLAANQAALALAFQVPANANKNVSDSGTGSESLAIVGSSIGSIGDTGTGVEYDWQPTIQSIAGAPTQDGFTVVSKVPGATSLRLNVSDLPDMSNIVTTIAAQTPDSMAYVRHVVTGLNPFTHYYYQLTDRPVGFSEQPTGPIGICRTLPPAGSPQSFRVALGACVTQAAGDGSALKDWHDWDADLYVFTGDFDYSGTVSTTLATQVGVYETQINKSVAYKRLIHDAWGYYCRSDHEAGPDNGDSNNTYTATNIAAAQEVFPFGTLGDQTNTPVHGLYQSWVVGRVRFIMIDIRNIDRSPGAMTDGPTKTMLGAQQLAWLKNQLIQPEALKVIISDVQWAGTATPFLLTNGPDKWWSYDNERQAIVSYINANKAQVKNVMLWHGDAHLVGTITPADNSSWGGFPVYCAAPMHNIGGGLDTGSFSQFYNNSDGDCRLYGRITITDDGATITSKFVGWDAANQVQRNTQTDVFHAPLELDSGAGVDTLAVHAAVGIGADSGSGTEQLKIASAVSLAQAGTGTDQILVSTINREVLTVVETIPLLDSGVGQDTLFIPSKDRTLLEVGTATETLATTVVKNLTDSGTGSEAFIQGTAKLMTDVGFG